MATRTRTVPSAPIELPLGRESMAWRVNSEPTVIFGGARALLLQVAHPSIAAGVEQHSSYRRDPWGRLFGTLHIVGKMTFGTPEESRRHQDLLKKFHEGVVGVADDGTEYRALDPALLLWVWATLLDTAVDLYQRCVGPLTDGEVEQYYRESKALAVGVGVPIEDCPTDWTALQEYFAAVVHDELHVGDSARAVATAVLAPPLPFGIAGVVSIPQTIVTAGLLPPSVREQYGLTWSRHDRRRFDAFFASLRLASRITYPPARRLPASITLRLNQPLRLPALQWAGGRIVTRRLQRAGFAA